MLSVRRPHVSLVHYSIAIHTNIPFGDIRVEKNRGNKCQQRQVGKQVCAADKIIVQIPSLLAIVHLLHVPASPPLSDIAVE